MACSLHHEGTVWPEASRIRVYEFIPGIDLPHLCVQCPDYPCINACKVGALKADEKTGAVIVDAEKCTGCGDCVRTCPGKVMRLHPGTGKAVVCDLCGGDPECVKVCNEAGYYALQLVAAADRDIYRLYSTLPEQLAKRFAETYFGEYAGEM